MRSDRPAPILVEHAPRDLPDDVRLSTENIPLIASHQGALFVDEMFRERRISSVEWRVLRDAIWPRHPATGKALLQLKPMPNPSSDQQGG